MISADDAKIAAIDVLDVRFATSGPCPAHSAQMQPEMLSRAAYPAGAEWRAIGKE